jgi:hypothetical protein
MGSEIGIRAFSRLAGVSSPAVRKGIATGRVHEGANGLDPTERTNALFIGTCHYRKIGDMAVRGRIVPRWAAICVPFPGRHPKPVFFFTPSGDTVLASGTFFDDWRFDSEEWTALDPSGGVHRLELVTHPAAPPPWMKEALREGKNAARPRTRAKGRQPARARS